MSNGTRRSNRYTPELATYSSEDYNVQGATGQGGILSTYQQEIADAQKDLESMVVAAKQQVLAKQQRDHEAAKAVYGITLGEMYDGDREAVQVYRDHIYNNYESGAYTNDPVQYQKDVAQLNSLITGFTNFYTETYGTSAADGTGTTYRDMVYNQTQGIENPFEDQGMKYDPNIDPFDQAQKTLAFRQMGGYAPNSVRVNEEGVLVARTLTYRDNGRHIVGAEMPIVEMQDRQVGNQTFMPALVEDTTTIFDYIKNNRQDIVDMQKRPTYFTVEEANAQYFDNEVFTNTKFQRDMIKENASASITNEDIKAYQEGTLEGNKKILIEGAINKSKQQFIKSATFGTIETTSDENKRSDGEDMFTGPPQDFSLTGRAPELNVDIEGRDRDPDAVTYSDEDLIGTAEGELIDYMGLSRGITPIEMTGGQYGDYKIIRIAAGDNGDRYAVIVQQEFVKKNAAGQYKTVTPGTPGASKVSGTVPIRINLTTPQPLNDAGDVDARIDDINRALIEYNGAFNELIVESQNRLRERSEIIAQERAEQKRLEQEQETADAEFKAADDPEIDAGKVDEEAVEDLRSEQETAKQESEADRQESREAKYAELYSGLSDREKQFYRAPGEQPPEFNIWGQRIEGGRESFGDRGAFESRHGEQMKNYAKDVLTRKLDNELSDDQINIILTSPELEGALKQFGFDASAVGGPSLQKAAELIGGGAYPRMREQINQGIDSIIEGGIVENIISPQPVEEAPVAEGAAEGAAELAFQKRIESALEAASKLDENSLGINVDNDLADIINYLESHPNPEQEKEKITKALEDDKVFYVANDSLIIYDPEEKAEDLKEVNKILAKSSEDRTEEEQELLSRYI